MQLGGDVLLGNFYCYYSERVLGTRPCKRRRGTGRWAECLMCIISLNPQSSCKVGTINSFILKRKELSLRKVKGHSQVTQLVRGKARPRVPSQGSQPFHHATFPFIRQPCAASSFSGRWTFSTAAGALFYGSVSCNVL